MNVTQILINSLITTAELGIIAIGLTMTFSILRFANFAHLDIAVLGAYFTYVFNVTIGLGLALSLLVAAVLTGFVGIFVDRLVFRSMRNASDITLMVASLGLSIAIRYGIQAVWGPQNVDYNYPIQVGFDVLGAHITQPQVAVLLIVTVAVVSFHLMLKYTRVGKAMRATATNPELAQASSIDTEWVILLTWFIGSAFAAIGGTLVAWDTVLNPYLGFNIVIPVFCIVLIGGVGSIYGAIIGALIVGLAQNVIISIDMGPILHFITSRNLGSTLQFPVAYKPAIVYLAVVIVLLLRPSGLARQEML